ncbi:hypothetical protein PPACK8108_LOCUS886 [Phakopsora pachyrhizi]|uniref:Pinin/SDK/MemA protein domain-containing protein n=1 Tax=Phakopsora pachyrhizi TaxID=170000 RepID=A0AAV0AGD9_PHAPC|nr:hypothetical protein PPACK8108_LOCUS886 [Phakopsora pachyrhizi]
MDHIFGSLPNVNPLGGGDPKQHTWALPQTTNESTDKDMLPNLGEAAPTPVNDEQLFRFPKEDEDIIEGEDLNQPALNSDIITNDIIVPPLAFPNNSSTSRKTSNSCNLNPNSHQKTSKSALPPAKYAELYEAKTDHEELQLKQGEITKDLEYKKLEYAKEEKDKELFYGREEKEKECEFKLLLAEKENEALKRKEDRDLLLAVVLNPNQSNLKSLMTGHQLALSSVLPSPVIPSTTNSTNSNNPINPRSKTGPKKGSHQKNTLVGRRSSINDKGERKKLKQSNSPQQQSVVNENVNDDETNLTSSETVKRSLVVPWLMVTEVNFEDERKNFLEELKEIKGLIQTISWIGQTASQQEPGAVDDGTSGDWVVGPGCR